MQLVEVNLGENDMKKEEISRFEKRFEKLCKIFFSEEKFGVLATKLLLGRIGMIIYNTESNYGHYRGKRGTSPLMYWEIGKELVEFARRRKKDHDKFKKKDMGISLNRIINEVRDFLREMANQPEDDFEDLLNEETDLIENDNQNIEDKIKFSATEFSKRSLTRCARLYDLNVRKEMIDPEIIFSIYAEFADQYGTVKNFRSEAKQILLNNLIEMRKTFGSEFTHLVARVYIYEFARLVNKTTKIKTNTLTLKYMIEDNLSDIKKAKKKVKEWYNKKYLKNPVKFEA